MSGAAAGGRAQLLQPGFGLGARGVPAQHRDHLPAHGADEPAGVGQTHPPSLVGDLRDQRLRIVEPAAHRRQHRVAGYDHHPGCRVARGAGLPVELGQRGLRLSDPAQLHQRHEPPEQAPALALQIRRPARQVDDLARGREPVQRAAGIPQRVQPRVEHLGQHRAIPAAPGQDQGVLDKCAPPARRIGVAQQRMGQPGQQPGPGTVLGHPAQRRFQQPDQPGIDLQEPLARHSAQGQRHNRITGRAGVEGRRQRAGRTRQPPGGHPQRVAHLVPFLSSHHTDRGGAQRAQPHLAADAQRHPRRHQHRDRRPDHPARQHRQHRHRIRPTPVQVIDDDQPARTRAQRHRCAVKIEVVAPRLGQQACHQFAGPPGVAHQLCPHPPPHPPRGRRPPQNLEPAAPRPLHGRIGQRRPT